MSSRAIYKGSKPILAISIDVGTTYSVASYTFLVPGEIPRIFDVTGYRGQENKESNATVPSVLLYSHEGDLLACGAETKKLGPWRGIRTERFKLLLSPSSMRIDTHQVNLPPGRTATDVLGDFLKYMHGCVRSHVINTHVNGRQRLSELVGTHVVLSYPNGWGSYQQDKMRDAATQGGLVPNTSEGRESIGFITEGEAQFHWCVDQAIAGDALEPGAIIVVADLGEETISVSSFLVQTLRPLRLKEGMAPDFALAGSTTVTERFLKSITRRLQGTPYEQEDRIDTLREEFGEDTMRIFGEHSDPEIYIRIGGRRDNFEGENGRCKIELGQLEIQRQEIVDAFEPSITTGVNAIRRHIAGRRGAHIFLVGCFAASPWVLSETKRQLRMAGIICEIKRADRNTTKAIAQGGLVSYLDRIFNNE